MKKESDPIAKYELFQRLNTGGSKLSNQEVRNCLMIMTNKSFYEFIISLNDTESFKNCLPITERRADEQYSIELLLRMLIPEYIDWSTIVQYEDFSQLLDKETIKLCNRTLNYDEIQAKFTSTFNFLYGVLNEDVFRKYNGSKHIGPVMAASFQVIATGVFTNIDEISMLPNRNEWLETKVHELYEQSTFTKNITPGVRSIPRFKDLSLFGIEYFKP